MSATGGRVLPRPANSGRSATSSVSNGRSRRVTTSATLSSTFPEPRYGTRRNPKRATLGPAWCQWHELLTGKPAIGWQRYVANVAGEVDAAGMLFYDTVVLVVGRQNGKTTLVESKNTGKAWRRDQSRIVYGAQDRGAARIKILDDYEARHLSRCTALRGRYTVVRSNGREGIDWVNGSKLVIVANTDTAGHGLSDVDDVTIDEAFSHTDLTIPTALEPTMLVNTDPQLWVASAVGDGTDGLLMHYQEVGVSSLTDPDTRVCYFDWSADDGADVLDREVWRATIPALEPYGFLTERAVARLAHDRPMFARTMLGIRPAGVDDQVIDRDVWARQTVDTLDDLAPPFVAAFATHHLRTSASIAVVGRRPAGGLGVAVTHRPGVGWLIPAMRALKSVHGRKLAEVWADRRAGDGVHIDRARTAGLYVDEMQPADFTTAAQTLLDLLGEPGHESGDLWHVGERDTPELYAAVAGARKRPLGESFAWSRLHSKGDVTPLAAATLAVWAYQRPPWGLTGRK